MLFEILLNMINMPVDSSVLKSGDILFTAWDSTFLHMVCHCRCCCLGALFTIPLELLKLCVCENVFV